MLLTFGGVRRPSEMEHMFRYCAYISQGKRKSDEEAVIFSTAVVSLHFFH